MENYSGVDDMNGRELNDVSVAIGRLTESSEAGQRQRADLFKKTDEISGHIAEIKETLATMPALIERVNTHEKSLGVLHKFKNRALIGVAGIGGGGGIVGAKLFELFKTKFGG